MRWHPEGLFWSIGFLPQCLSQTFHAAGKHDTPCVTFLFEADNFHLSYGLVDATDLGTSDDMNQLTLKDGANYFERGALKNSVQGCCACEG